MMEISNSPTLELALEEALRKLDNTMKDEHSRRLTLRILLLQKENDALQSQLQNATNNEQDRAIATRLMKQGQKELMRSHLELLKSMQALQTQLVNEKTASQHATQRLCISQQNEDKLEQQLLSLNSKSSKDSIQLANTCQSLEEELKTAKIRETGISEDLEATRKTLDCLKRELINLQSKGSQDDDRGIIQIESEATSSGNSDAGRASSDSPRIAITSVRQELSKCQEELRRQMENASHSQRDWEARLKTLNDRERDLERKVDLWRSKFQSTRDQLKECRQQLEAQVTATREPSMTSRQDSRKSARSLSKDHNIGTPDGVTARGKKALVARGRKESSTLVEKSNFSITPYLNRTVNFEVASALGEHDEERLVEEKPKANIIKQSKLKTIESSKDNSVFDKAPRLARLDPSTVTGVLVELKSASTNINSQRSPPQLLSQGLSTLEEVEEAESPAFKKLKRPTVANTKPVMTDTTEVVDYADPKKKKRKLLASIPTLFDEDAVDARRSSKVEISRGSTKGRNPNNKGVVRLGLGGSAAFGAFSPLKRDRRGVNASFLA